MNLFFEYLFCRCYWWFSQIVLERKYIDHRYHSVIGLALFQTYSIVPLYALMNVLFLKSFHLAKIFGINPFLIIGIVVAIIDFIYFNKKRCTVLWKQFKKIPKKEKKKKDIYCILYITIIIIVNTILFIYFRFQNLK